MISSISPLLSKFVSANGQTNPFRKTLKYKFNTKVLESRTNLFNFAKDDAPRNLSRK